MLKMCQTCVKMCLVMLSTVKKYMKIITGGMGSPRLMSSKHDSYSTLPSGPRRARRGRRVLHGRSNRKIDSTTCAHSLMEIRPAGDNEKRITIEINTQITHRCTGNKAYLCCPCHTVERQPSAQSGEHRASLSEP